MLDRDISDPEHWRDRAARMRGLAIKMLGTQAAILMNDLADDYDRLALSLSVRIAPATRA
jgi:hypothetical protein